MPTNIVNATANPVGGNAWQTIGTGAQGLAGLLAGVMGARAADEAAKKAAGQQMLSDAGYKTPGMEALMTTPIASNPFAGGAGSGDLGTATLPAAKPIAGMVQPFESNPSGPFVSVGPSTQPPDLMKALQFSSPGGVANELTPITQLLRTRNFPASTFQYGGL